MGKHLFHYKWQGIQYEELKSSLRHGEVMAVIDFGQNINHKKQREAQGGHYNRRQSAIFPFVCNYLCQKCSALVTHEMKLSASLMTLSMMHMLFKNSKSMP